MSYDPETGVLVPGNPGMRGDWQLVVRMDNGKPLHSMRTGYATSTTATP